MSDHTKKRAGITPGPWTLQIGDHTHRYSHVIGPDETTVHYLYNAHSRTYERENANGRLISATPDLLEAAENAAHLLATLLQLGPDISGAMLKTMNALDVAIAKATDQ